MENYFEGIDFTKIEIILLVGVVAVFLPFIISPVEYNVSEIEDLVKSGDFTGSKNAILESVAWYYEGEYETVKEKMKEGEMSKIEIDIAIYKELKSYEFQDRIFFAFGIAMVILIVSVYLSRKGYTSYTPWLEKLANDKLEFDLKLLQYVDRKELKQFYHSEFKLDNKEEVNDKEVLGWRPLDEDEKWYSVFTEKIDYKFYEIFFENLQWEYGDLNYGDETDDKGEWIAKKKQKFNSDTPNSEPEEGFRIMDLYNNSELVPKKNKEIKRELLDDIDEEDLPTRCSKCNIPKFENHYQFLEHMRDAHQIENPMINTIYDKILLEMPIFELNLNTNQQAKLKEILIRKIQIDLLYYSVMMNFRRGLVVATEEWALADEKLKKSELNQVKEDAEELDLAAIDLRDTVRDVIKGIIDEFHIKGDEADVDPSKIPEDELKKMIKNLIPFLKGVDKDEYDRKLNKSLPELTKILEQVVEFGKNDSQKKSKISKKELKRKITKLIPILRDVMDDDFHIDATDDFKKQIKEFIPILRDVEEYLGDEDEVDVEIRNKINRIKEKMANRNKWDSDDWRAMGSIYYKWKESGDGGSNLKGKDEQGSSPIEKFWFWWNYGRKGLDENKMILDPTEVAWNEHRTIRAANSLSKSFGYEVNEDTGKAVIFFGVVFALIISTALLNSLDIVIETMQLPLNCDPDCYHTEWEFLKSNFGEYQYLFMLFLCFFPLGILFYHQGTILLSSKAAEQMTLGSDGLVFVNFLFILLQAIIVYFLASSIGDVNAFLTFLILLVTVDAIWVAIFTINDMRDDVRDAPVFIEWIVFDIIIGLFAGIFMINYASAPPILEEDGWGQNLWIFVALLTVLTTRAVVDYSYGWRNFWSKFAGAE